MNTFNEANRKTLRSIVTSAIVVTLGAGLTSMSPAVRAHDRTHKITPPAVPTSIQVPAGNRAFAVGKASGTQNYICLPSGAGFAWTLFTPQATLFSASDKQIITHFFSPNPDENGTVRAAWQDSRDASTVWAQAFPPSFDPAFVAPGAVPWLLLETVGTEEGPRGGDELTDTTFIHRVNTAGGLAPSTGCARAADVGSKSFIPYTADYFFYRSDSRHDD
jgi:hypothetical protein